MIKNIDQTHPIFKSGDYQKDIIPFNLMEIIKQSPLMLDSDGKNFIIGMSSPNYPVWIWTSDHISGDALWELCDYFFEKFKDGNSVHFVAKPKVVNMLSNKYIAYKKASTQCIHMESFAFTDFLLVLNTAVTIQKPCDKDWDSIAECIQKYAADCFGYGLTYNDSTHEAESFITSPKSFVIKREGKVVSMACSSRETEKHITINHVYTRPEYRNRGFAAAIVAHICKLILEEGKIPVLYVDLSNPAAIKTYKKVGFIAKGKVDDVILKWGDMNPGYKNLKR